MGWCRLKVAGVEHCGLCGLAHLGHGRTCPQLNDEGHITTILQTLKESTESREIVDQATKYLQTLRSELVQRRRAKERREQEAMIRRQAQMVMNGSEQTNSRQLPSLDTGAN